MSGKELTKSKSTPRDIGSVAGSGDQNLDQMSANLGSHDSDIFSFLRHF
jgi:hypothetical protein